ncbi:MAG: glycosyltransferase family 2 protein [Bacillota bacterium]|nr:glycosyltransferase family 2 protein [Bacillota bacterium]MDW7684058.1 glycosyltransferase family 2 protein [Bacillota bacterium]
MKISAIIPAYNEELRIGDTVRALLSVPEINEIIVVDDGSADQTAVRAKEAGAQRVIVLDKNRGKGGALSRGVEEAKGDVLCFVDGDLGSSAGQFGKLLVPVLQGDADMVVASFPRAKRPAGIGLVRGVAVWGINKLAGFRPTAPLSGQRVLRRDIWDKALCARDGFGVEVGLTVDCLRNGFRMKEIPVNMSHRESGRDWQGFKHRGKQFVSVSRTLLRLWVKRRVKV